jgi:FkbM family methyltransferase
MYLRIFYPRVVAQKANELAFYRTTLKPKRGSIFFDIGANVGDKAQVFRQIADQVVALEPNPATLQTLRERFAGRTKIVMLDSACGSTPGTAEMTVFSNSHAYSTISNKWNDGARDAVDRLGDYVETKAVTVTTLDILIQRFGRPHYIKIDVEGFELEVLKGLSESVPFVSFECNLPDFCKETLACITALKDLSETIRFNYVTTEPPACMSLDNWIDDEELSKIIRFGGHKYMEIYAHDQLLHQSA